MSHVCVYHQWSYDPAGNLVGVPFRKGINGKGGYDESFDPSERGLQKLEVTEYCGLIFACADARVEPIEAYLGPEMRPWVERLLGKEIVILGYTRQDVDANWKLYAENVRDPYHASLLHLFHTTFGIYRSSMGGGITQDAKGRHSFLRSFKIGEAAETKDYKDAGLRTFQQGMRLNDESILAARDEFPVPATNAIQQIFPNLLVAQIQNTLMTRQIVPKGPGRYELIFTYFGYADDDADLREKRMLQSNFVGPAGYISLEDGYATELVQQAVADGRSVRRTSISVERRRRATTISSAKRCCARSGITIARSWGCRMLSDALTAASPELRAQIEDLTPRTRRRSTTTKSSSGRIFSPKTARTRSSRVRISSSVMRSRSCRAAIAR